MCGIAGSTLPDGRRLTETMVAALTHRGPDDAGHYADPGGQVALGARRLQVIDPAGGHQPCSNEDGTVWVVHNGEIYNFERLREHLEADGHRFSSRCDSEVLVHLYERYGPDLVHAIEGMFAFAIWDQAAQSLLLARDRSGEKPLFVQPAGDGISFASELGALLAASPGSQDIDAAAIDAFCVLGYLPPSSSVVQGIVQLAPGTVMQWRPGGPPTSRRYWEPPAAADGTDSRKLAELVAETGELLTRAVGSRLVSDVPLGLFLSGGLDSSLVAAIAREAREVRTFSIGYDVGDVNETSAAAMVAEQLGTQHEELLLRSDDVEGLALRAMSEIDQPLADRALVPMYALCERARRDVTVIVGGEGADEYFAGYPRYRWLERAQMLRRRAPGIMPVLSGAAKAWPWRERRERLSVLTSRASSQDQNLLWISEGRMRSAASLYGERLRDHRSRHDSSSRPWARDLHAHDSAANGAIEFDRNVWLPGDVLTKADRAGMMNSLEVRTPFLERSLIEFACSVSFGVHAGDGGKALLKGVFAQRLAGVPAPPKRGFRTPAADWLRGPLSGYLEHCVNDSRVVRDGWLRRDALRPLVLDHLSARADHSAKLWPVLALNAWLEGPHGAHVS